MPKTILIILTNLVYDDNEPEIFVHVYVCGQFDKNCTFVYLNNLLNAATPRNISFCRATSVIALEEFFCIRHCRSRQFTFFDEQRPALLQY